MRRYNFGNGKWVFIDWLGIEPGYGTHWDSNQSSGYCVPSGLTLKTHSPDVMPEFCISLDKPWEKGQKSYYATFLEDNGIFRCWYQYYSTGYAESDDGIHWKKPNLGLQEWQGSTKNNLLNFGAHGQCVFIDPVAKPAERYKLAGGLWTETEKSVIGGVSPDGLHWTGLPAPILKHNHADTQSSCLYDEDINKYLLYTRQRDGIMQRRGVNRSASDDFRCFPPSQPVLECNPLDPPDWDLYCNGYSKWPDAPAAHLMRISMYKHTSDIVDVHLAVSRDGVIWNRPQGQRPWISGGPSYPGPYPSVYACSGILETGPGEWSTYLGVSHTAHNDTGKTMAHPAGILRARMRTDGFMSLSCEGHGEAWTIPFTLECDTIRLNVKTGYSGSVRAEILLSADAITGGGRRAANENITGYTIDDCIPISGDHIDVPLVWKNGPELEKLRGKTVRLHIQMYKADLYAVDFQKHKT